MARLPDYTSLGVRDPNSVRAVPTFDGRDYEAEALGKVGNALSNAGAAGVRYVKQGQAEDLKLAEAKADAAFVTRHTAIVSEQGNAPDAKTYAQQSQEALTAAASTLPQGEARDLWVARQAGTLARGGASIQGLVEKKETDSALAGIIRDEDTALRTIAARPADEDKAKLLKSVGAQWDAAAAAGRITEVQADSYKRQFGKRVAMTELDGVPPEERLAALQGAPTNRDGIIDRITGVESGGVPTAKNPNSSATGLGQFIDSTWLATVRGHRPDLLKGRSEAQVLALRNDPTLSREMTGYLVDDNSKALGDAKLPVTNGTIYLSHFLGSGGAAAVLKAAPGTPISDVLKDDQIAANRSILAGKTVDSVKAWADRKMGAVASAPYANILDPETRRNVLAKTQAEVDRDQRRAEIETRAESAALSTRIADDMASVERTGVGSPDLKGEDISRVFGREALTSWQDGRARAFRVHGALDGIDALPRESIEKRVQSLDPKPGGAGYVEDLKAFEAARKRADGLIRLRASDPAASVESLPGVQAAAQGASLDKPATFAPLVKARLTAMDQVGIPEDNRIPITRAEAQALWKPIELAVKGGDASEVRDALKATAKDAQAAFGEHADDVIAAILREGKASRETSETAAAVLRRLARDEPPTRDETRALDNAQKNDAARTAVSGLSPTPQVFPAPDAGAIGLLRRTPALKEQYDRVYGPGAADKVLKVTR